jgi:hypothetical protein
MTLSGIQSPPPNKHNTMTLRQVSLASLIAMWGFLLTLLLIVYFTQGKPPIWVEYVFIGLGMSCSAVWCVCLAIECYRDAIEEIKQIKNTQ